MAAMSMAGVVLTDVDWPFTCFVCSSPTRQQPRQSLSAAMSTTGIVLTDLDWLVVMCLADRDDAVGDRICMMLGMEFATSHGDHF